MKKVLALVLAVVMALGMTTVAFGYTTQYDLLIGTNANVPGMFDFYFDDDGKVDASTGTNSLPNITPGKTVYIPIGAQKATKDSGGSAYYVDTKNLSDLGNYKLSYTLDDGKTMIESVKYVSMKVKNAKAGSNFVDGQKYLFIAVKLKDNFITDDVTIDLTFKITSKSTNAQIHDRTDVVNNKYDYYEQNMTFTTQFTEQADVTNGYVNIDDQGNKVTFDADADDVTLMFKKDVEVQGNMKGQKAVVVRLDTSNSAIEDKYPDATIRFFAGDKDTFRRDVTVTMPYDASSENPYLYVVDAKGNLTKLCGGSTADKAAGETNAKYDDALGAFVFKTKTLGNYVISDTELKNTTSSDVDAPVEGDKPAEGDEPNPGTGANDFVGLAVAMAVVSIAGIAVAKRK